MEFPFNWVDIQACMTLTRNCFHIYKLKVHVRYDCPVGSDKNLHQVPALFEHRIA